MFTFRYHRKDLGEITRRLSRLRDKNAYLSKNWFTFAGFTI